MKVYRSYKTELKPNNVQRTALLRHAGAARWVYNWGLNQIKEAYAWGEKYPTAMDLHKELVKLKKTELLWLGELSKWVPQIALQNVEQAFKNFFRRLKTKKGKPGFPRFKSRKKGIGSFTLIDPIYVFPSSIQLPKLGTIRLKEKWYLPIGNIKILRAIISERVGRWFVSLSVVETLPDPKPKEGEAIGIDVGIKSLAVCSNGMVFENPRALKRAHQQMRILQKRVSRRQKGSNRRKKAVRDLAKLHYRISCIRKDSIHKATTAIITKQPRTIVIETLNVAGMVKNHCLAQAVSDSSMGEFHRQIEYKAEWNGIPVVKADRWFPSSKKCCVCGNVKKELSLADREYICEKCGNVIDRDLNAAINLKDLAVEYPVTAHCPGSSDFSVKGKRNCWLGGNQTPINDWISFEH